MDSNAALDQYKDGEELADQFRRGREHAKIIDESQHDHDGCAENDPQDVLPEFKREGETHQEGQVDRESSEVRDRFLLMFETSVWGIDNAVLQRGLSCNGHTVQ